MTRDHDDPELPGADHADDDLRLGPIPAPDAPAGAGEQGRARAFGDLVDKVLAGRAPAAVPAEDRALLEVATALRAAVRPVELPAARQRALIESALATAIDRRGGGGASPVTDPSLPVARGVVPLQRARARRAAPWIVAAVSSVVAVAAIAMLVLQRAPAPSPDAPVAPPVARPLPDHWRSRPADPLIGAIPAEASGDALRRVDAIYADRLAGFRERTLVRGGPR